MSRFVVRYTQFGQSVPVHVSCLHAGAKASAGGPHGDERSLKALVRDQDTKDKFHITEAKGKSMRQAETELLSLFKELNAAKGGGEKISLDTLVYADQLDAMQRGWRILRPDGSEANAGMSSSADQAAGMHSEIEVSCPTGSSFLLRHPYSRKVLAHVTVDGETHVTVEAWRDGTIRTSHLAEC